VAARAVPLREELGGQGDSHVVVLSDAAEEVAGHPEVVTDLNTKAGADLVLPLAGHDLTVGAADVDASVEASLVVGVGDGAAEGGVGTDGAVVGALGTGVTLRGPAERSLLELVGSGQKGVLLLDTVPGLLGGDFTLVPDLVGEVAEVGVGGDELLAVLVLPVKGLAHDQNVVTATERVGIVGDGLEDNLRFVGDGLVGGGAVVVPLGDVGEGGDLLGESAGLGAGVHAGAVDPDVLGDDLALLVNIPELVVVLIVEHCVVKIECFKF